MTAPHNGRAWRLVSHNVFWFQGAPFKGKDPQGCDAGVLAQLLELYAELSPDVLCLQEVHTAALAQRVAEALDMHVRHCPGGHEPQYAGALLWRGSAHYHDWRDRADTDGPAFRIWQQIELHDAHPARALRVMNVHLPSNSQRPPEQGRQQRAASLGPILAQQPDVLMGDFNARSNADELAPLRDAGYLDVAAHFRLDHLGTSGPDKRIDYVWAHDSLADRVQSYAVTDLSAGPYQPHHSTKDALSDHWPLCIELAPLNPESGQPEAMAARQ